jgi:hypothetical protein
VGDSGEFGLFLDVYNPKIVIPELSSEFIFKRIMSPERREHTHRNEHKLVPTDSQFR